MADMSVAACPWFQNAFFGFEDDVVDNLFIVLQAHCDRYEFKIFSVKLVVKYCNERNGEGEKKTVRPWMYHVHVSICAFKGRDKKKLNVF